MAQINQHSKLLEDVRKTYDIFFNGIFGMHEARAFADENYIIPSKADLKRFFVEFSNKFSFLLKNKRARDMLHLYRRQADQQEKVKKIKFCLYFEN